MKSLPVLSGAATRPSGDTRLSATSCRLIFFGPSFFLHDAKKDAMEIRRVKLPIKKSILLNDLAWLTLISIRENLTIEKMRCKIAGLTLRREETIATM